MSFGQGSNGGTFNFGQAVQEGDAYTPSLDELLQRGNYVCTCTEAEKGTSSGNFPMVTLRWENEQGSIRDWLVISPAEFSVQKLLGLVDGMGLARPVPGTDINEHTGELSDEYVAKFLRRKAGVIVREEADNRPEFAGQMRPKVQGYCVPERIKTPGPTAVATLGSDGSSPSSTSAARSATDLKF